MPKINSFSSEALKKISEITCDIETHRNLNEIFNEIGLSEFDNNEAKHSRIFSVLTGRQKHDNAGNIVCIFLEKMFSPVRFVNDKDNFNILREKVNEVLAFSGIELDESGKCKRSELVQTLSESEKKANRLKSILRERNIHSDIIQFCKSELIEKNYFHCALEATKSLADKIRNKSGLQGDGADLIDKSFGGMRPKLALNSLQYDYEKSEQAGFVNLAKGVFGTFRNPTAHAPKIHWNLSEQDALDLLTILSYLHRRVDQSIKTLYTDSCKTNHSSL